MKTKSLRSRPKWLLLTLNSTAQHGENNKISTLTKKKNTAEQTEYGDIIYTTLQEPVEYTILPTAANSQSSSVQIRNLEIPSKKVNYSEISTIVPFLVRSEPMKKITKQGQFEENVYQVNSNEQELVDQKFEIAYCPEENPFYLDCSAVKNSQILAINTKKDIVKIEESENYNQQIKLESTGSTELTSALNQESMKTISLEKVYQENSGIMEYDLVEEINWALKDEDLYDLDILNDTTALLENQISSTIISQPLNVQQSEQQQQQQQITINNLSNFEQIPPIKKQPEMNIYDEEIENIFYEVEKINDEDPNVLHADFNNKNLLTQNEETYDILSQNNEFDLLDNSQLSQSYPLSTKNNPMLCVNPFELSLPIKTTLITAEENTNEAMPYICSQESSQSIKLYDFGFSLTPTTTAAAATTSGTPVRVAPPPPPPSAEDNKDCIKRKYELVGSSNCNDNNSNDDKKRLKLNIKIEKKSPELLTPNIVEETLDLEESFKSVFESSPKSNVVVDDKDYVGNDDDYDDDDDDDGDNSEVQIINPPSVQSDIYTVSTAPPTPSSASTSSSAVFTPQKKRGRPRKQHSDMPDPSELKNLPESERKYREQRYKNNEASRQSRLNKKEKEERDKAELTQLEEEHKYLSARKEEIDFKYSQLKELLRTLVLGDRR